jgi:tRNA (cmo5U34)-methyltransferase
MPDSSVSLGHEPAARWAFDESVAACFDDMLSRSIPEINNMRQACLAIGRKYVQHQTDIIDLGCSRGDALVPFIREFGACNRFVGIETSPPMLQAARERFASAIESGYVVIREADLRTSYPHLRASLTLCVLTLQFTPIEYRQRIVRDVFRSTLPGGAMILVEKILGSSAEIDSAMVEAYYGLKSDNGYSRQEIDRKRLSLEGVLVPVTARWNEELLRSAGFTQVDCFWRWMNFAGWVAVREA